MPSLSWIFVYVVDCMDLRLHVVDGIGRLDLESDHSPGSEGLNEDLCTTTTEDKAEGGLLLDVVVQKGTPVFELFASEDEALRVRGNAVWYVSGQTHLRFVVAESWDLRKFEVL